MIVDLPDGGEIDLPIEFMIVKDSLFIPTLKMEETKNMIQRLAHKLSFKVSCKQAIIDGYLGVLFWRLE